MNILVTGYAGFIGYHITKKIIDEKKIKKIFCLDNFNKYYSVTLKKNRAKDLNKIDTDKKIIQINFDIKDTNKIISYFKNKKVDLIIHLAAQAGINYSIVNPQTYIDSNLIGFFSILELAKKNKIPSVIYASTSSVYGKNDKEVFNENDMNNTPLQLYSATKISNEIMAHAYSNLHKINFFGLRFFTVYGPWGRPDMAIYKFANQIKNNKKINLFKVKNSYVKRDFTYIEDVVTSINLIIHKYCYKKKIKDHSISKIYNIGRGKPLGVNKLIFLYEKNLSKKIKTITSKLKNSEMNHTFCDNSLFYKEFGFKPKISIKEGLPKFLKWFDQYHKL